MFTEQKRTKLFAALIGIIVFVFSFVPLSVHAQEADTEPENIGVSTICPDDMYEPSDSQIQPYTTSRPTNVWNIATKGKYSFLGAIKNNVTLYSNYKFKGKTQYTMFVKNTGKSTLTVKAKTITHTYSTTNIKAGDSKIIGFSNINATTEFYLTFEGSSFSGYIK